MTHHQVDVAVIGAGSAGLAAFRAAGKGGGRVLLIEAGPFGTTCADHGCMPSKVLLAAANGLYRARQLGPRGIVGLDDLHAQSAAVMEYVRAERDHFVSGVLDEMRSIPATQIMRGHARFLSGTTLAVTTEQGDEHTVQARGIVIATGALPVIPEKFDVFGARLLTSDTLFEVTELPRRVAVFGAGPIALELGQALSRLGVSVHMFGQAGKVGGISDPAVRNELVRALQDEFYFDPDAQIVDMTLTDAMPTIQYRALTGATATIEFDAVLVGTGRRPALEGLGMENSGLSLDEHGVPEFDPVTQQCGDSVIFMAGDCDAHRPWLSDAVDEGARAGAGAACVPDAVYGKQKAALAIVFCEPQIALVGVDYAALPKDGYVVGTLSFENQGRSRVMRENRGCLHIYADVHTGRLLGAQGCGPALEHLAHLLAWAVQLELKVQDMVNLPFYHPVVEEGLRTALRQAVDALHEP
jgi:dihydrolipoamide dehydrogenase